LVQIPDRARIGQTAFMTSEYVLTLGCPDRTGIVARIATLIADAGGSITEAGYHADPDTNWFFTRQVVSAESLSFGFDELRTRFAALAAEFGAPDGWRVRDARKPRRVVVLVSREGHCLYDLLGRYTGGELNMAIRAVVANHTDLAAITRAHDIPFHHVEFAPGAEGKRAAFDEIRTLVDAEEPDAVVLARFMQIVPPDLCEAWAGRMLNIHHSFLPSFIGARPYHQAHTRGVKLVGATCHYVTENLDAGPIIEQDVIRVDHSDTVADMVRKGRDIEKVVLARGLRAHLEDRVLVHGNRTVVFH
jgi:formyltetrahydrofolate deformylase